MALCFNAPVDQDNIGGIEARFDYTTSGQRVLIFVGFQKLEDLHPVLKSLWRDEAEYLEPLGMIPAIYQWAQNNNWTEFEDPNPPYSINPQEPPP